MTVPGCSCLGYFIYSLLYTVPWQQWVDGWKGYFSSEFTERNPLWRGVLVAGVWVSWVQCVHSRKSRKTLFFFFNLSLSFLYSPSPSAQDACWGSVLPTIHVGLPTTVRLIYRIPHSHAKRSIPIVIPKPTEANPRLTVTGLEWWNQSPSDWCSENSS